MNSVYSKNPAIFRQLAMFISIKSLDNERNTCLHIASSIGALEILRICIEEMELKDSKNIYQQTALHFAENPEVIEYLIIQDFDVNAQDINGWSVLHYAIYKESQECVRVLLQIGINIMLIDNKGYTVLDFARKYSPNLVPILEQEINKPKIPLDHNNNVNAKGKNDVDIEKEIFEVSNKSLAKKEYFKEAENLRKSKKDFQQRNIELERGLSEEKNKVLSSPEVDAQIVEVNSEGDDNLEEFQIQTPLVKSELLKRQSSSDSLNKSQITPKIQSMISEILLKTPSDFMSLSDFGVEVIKYDELKIRELLGQGAYGKVYRGYFRESEVAIKVINTDKLDDRLAKEFIKEIEILVKVRHKRFLLLFGVCIEGPLCIVTELSKGGNLASAIERNVLSLDQKLKISLQIAEGIHYIHSKNPPIVHRDLKPQNILLDEYNQVKIGDLGLSRAIEKVANIEKINSTRICAGTIRYMAPELYYEEPICSRATDIWAYGCVLYNLFTGTQPWNGLEINAVQRRLILKEPFIYDADLLPGIEYIIKNCCATDPDTRIGFKEIKKLILEMLGIQNSQQS